MTAHQVVAATLVNAAEREEVTEIRDFASVFQSVESEIRAIPEAELEPINIDVPSAVTTVLGALPEIDEQRPAIDALPGVNHALVAKLGDYARALGYAHSVFRAASGPNDGVSELGERIIETRDVLVANAAVLASHGILDFTRVQKLKAGLGFKNSAFDVIGLVALLREHWTVIAGRTLLTREYLDEAAKLAEQLVTAVGVKEQSPVTASSFALVRQQAYTLFVRAYDEVRRALGFIHWHSNLADEIAPSLWAGRGGRKAPTTEPAPSTPPQPPTAVTPRTPPTTPNTDTPGVGLPGASPFRDS